MASVIPLGKFERVDLTTAWPTEDGNFTPWLASPANVALLGEALGMELEVEAEEHRVGSFVADILARSLDETEHRVVIENQFGRTDHRHLGQILTYLAGIEGAKTVVWIAETIQPDHRAAVDWLNANTTDDFSFFAIEIELWRIDGSPPAPRFNVIASPNDWTRTARTASRRLDGPLPAAHQMRIAYWSSFADYLKAQNSTFKIRRENRDNWFPFSIGRAGVQINTTITQEGRIGVELYMHNDPEKIGYHQLLEQKANIEQDFGEPLEWQDLPGKKAWRIGVFLHGVNPGDPAQFEGLHKWMLEKMGKIRKVFGPRVKVPSFGEPDALASDAAE
ncbi:MAG: DUF4268 domain-containing protein [Rhodospirillales bacterium]|nr:DUF4268 domain-containing protein [Rhodospirillales bacterium]